MSWMEVDGAGWRWVHGLVIPILNGYQSNYSILLTFHQRCVNSLMIEFYNQLNVHSPDIMSDIFKLKENIYNLPNVPTFHTENVYSLKYGLDAVPYRASQLWQQVPNDIREATSLAFFKNRIKSWKCEDFPRRSSKCFFKISGISDQGPLVTDGNMSVN